MIPFRFLTLMRHHHGSIRNQKHRGFLPSKIHQRPFHSKCRCHPYTFLRHGRRRTCPLVIQLFRTRLGSMKLHSRRQQFMKMFYHRPFRLTRLHLSQHRFQKLRRFHLWQNVGDLATIPSVGDLVRFIQFQKLRRFHLWQNVGDLAHFISRILYRSVGDPMRLLFRPQRHHSFGGAPVFLRALRPFRRLRDTQSDPSERVKRSRLAPAQVMSTALAKHCDWSLGFDGRGPVLDETRSILLPSLQRISVCCLRPWNVDVRNGGAQGNIAIDAG